MIIKLRLIFPLLFCAFQAAQAQQELPLLRQILVQGDLSQLNRYIAHNDEVYHYDLPDNYIYWRLYREVAPGYFEGILQIFYGVPVSRNKHYRHPYRVEVLVKDSAIIYYTLKGIDEAGRYNTVEDSATRYDAFERYRADYNSFYKSPPNYNHGNKGLEILLLDAKTGKVIAHEREKRAEELFLKITDL